MTPKRAWYVKVYATTTMSLAEVQGVVHELTAGEADSIGVVTFQLVIDVRRNGDGTTASGDYLDAPFILDIGPNEGAVWPIYLTQIRVLLSGLRDHGIGAVAACSFESELADPGDSGFLG